MSNKAGSKWIRAEKRLAIYARDAHACVYCGSAANLSLDHIVPRELGGTHEASNLVTACVRCNSARRDLPLSDWLDVMADRGVDRAELRLRVARARKAHVDLHEAKRLLAARGKMA